MIILFYFVKGSWKPIGFLPDFVYALNSLLDIWYQVTSKMLMYSMYAHNDSAT